MCVRAFLHSACAVGFVFLAAPAWADTEADVKAAHEAWNAAFNEQDAEAVAGFYTEDAVFLPPSHEVLEGPAGVETFFSGLFEQGVTGHSLELIRVMEEGDQIVAAARWSAEHRRKVEARRTSAGWRPRCSRDRTTSP